MYLLHRFLRNPWRCAQLCGSVKPPSVNTGVKIPLPYSSTDNVRTSKSRTVTKILAHNADTESMKWIHNFDILRAEMRPIRKLGQTWKHGIEINLVWRFELDLTLGKAQWWDTVKKVPRRGSFDQLNGFQLLKDNSAPCTQLQMIILSVL